MKISNNKNNMLENLLLIQFDFLKEIGYTTIEVYTGNQYDYDLGITMTNKRLNLKFSIAYYSSNPVNRNENSNAILLKLFNETDHIDFSRLISNIAAAKTFNQYFVLNHNEDLILVIKNIAHILKDEYLDLFKGNKWITIKYNLKDDY